MDAPRLALGTAKLGSDAEEADAAAAAAATALAWAWAWACWICGWLVGYPAEFRGGEDPPELLGGRGPATGLLGPARRPFWRWTLPSPLVRSATSISSERLLPEYDGGRD